MLLKLLFEQHAEWKEERTRVLTELDCSQTINRPENTGNQSKIFKMVNPLQYCGGAKELDKFLETLRSNFASHKHLFPRGDPDQIKYAVSFLNTWNNHLDMTERQPENTDPAERVSDPREAKDKCLDDFQLFAN
jgi:predicted transcriptional regulator of viral defense system